MAIEQGKIKGEESTGYEGPDGKGPFECENCSYFSAGSCGQSTMMRLSKLPRVKGGRVKVDPEGCCEYVDRMGKQEDEDEDSPGSQIMKMGGEGNG